MVTRSSGHTNRTNEYVNILRELYTKADIVNSGLPGKRMKGLGEILINVADVRMEISRESEASDKFQC